ncbi:hypothetical protein ACHAW6_016046, partial [Cyclotella cf. meneghiniana]
QSLAKQLQQATASLIAKKAGLKHINVSELIKQHECYDGYVSRLGTNLYEDKLLDIMKNASKYGSADYHSCELFPERWFDLVLVLGINIAHTAGIKGKEAESKLGGNYAGGLRGGERGIRCCYCFRRLCRILWTSWNRCEEVHDMGGSVDCE